MTHLEMRVAVLEAEVKRLRESLVAAPEPERCGYADEGWGEFPCTKPKGHDGEHGWSGRVSLAPLSPGKETP